jgi:DNA-binding response OmpR family regulator
MPSYINGWAKFGLGRRGGLLVIEDEERLAGILKSKLGEIGFTVDIAGSAEDGSIALELINYDAAVLDLGLPDGDGLTVLT